MDVFFSGGDVDASTPLFAPDLTFSGPFYEYDSAAAYIDALRADPMENAHYEIIRAYEDASSACLVYRFTKPGISTPTAQFFEVSNGKISKILLVFDTGAFH